MMELFLVCKWKKEEMEEIREREEGVRKISWRKPADRLEPLRKEEEACMCSEKGYLVCEPGEQVG